MKGWAVRMLQRRIVLAIGLGLLGSDAFAAASVVATGTSTAEPTCGPRCVLVNVVTARRQEVARTIVLTGAVAPKYQTDLAFRVSGKIVQRLVEVGEHVGANQVLAKLDPRDQAVGVDTARAGLASAQALLVQATVAFERQQSLLKNGYTTRPAFDAAQQQLRTQQAALASAKATLGTAEEQLAYTDLKAGVAGVVVGRNAEAGQVVRAGQTVFVLAQDGPRDAVFDVYEAALTEPPASRVVRIALQADPSVTTIGTVREISPSVDNRSGAVRVKVGLDRVPPRMSLGAAVIGSGEFKAHEAMVLPRAALFRWDDRPAVWLYDPRSRSVAPRPIVIERYAGDTLVLSDGIAPGDSVVTAGIQLLHPGQIVAVVAAEPH